MTFSDMTSALLGANLWFWNPLTPQTPQMPRFQRNSKYHDSHFPKEVYRPGYQTPRY